MAERTGLEPAASGVTGRRYNRLNYRSVEAFAEKGGRNWVRTSDPYLVRVLLFRLSYPPFG